MGGTLLNFITVALGSAIGLLLGNRLPARIQESVMLGLGLTSLFIGISNAGSSGNIIIPLLSIVGGVIVGELLDLHGRLGNFGIWLERRFGVKDAAAGVDADTGVSADDTDAAASAAQRARFIQGFVTASLLFCIGPLTFVGAMQDGMGLAVGFQQLAIKSVLDMFAAMALAASLGVGVAFSLIMILVVQGGLALGGSVLGSFLTTAQVNELTATGGLLIIGISLILLDLKQPRLANFLPALVIAPLLVGLAQLLGIGIYPF